MRIRSIPFVLLPAVAVGLGVIAFASHALKINESQRPTNVELQILSQSCFQGEIEPCG